MSAFTASKYALAGFTDAIRAEVAPLGVHVGQVGGMVVHNTENNIGFQLRNSS
jgi:short-subunit dehydrogenase